MAEQHHTHSHAASSSHGHGHGHSHSHGHGHSHSHGVGDDATAYFMDQLFAIAVCGALACVTLVLWQSGLLGRMLHPKFHPLVLAGGLVLLVLVTLRAIAVWLEAGQLSNVGQGSGVASQGTPDKHALESNTCTHDHSSHDGELHTHSHSHSHAHSHSHGHGEECNHPDASLASQPIVDEHAGHSHGWAPWRYIVLLLPILLYFLALSNPVFDQEPTVITKSFSEDPLPYITTFIIIFRSILWEALPFIVLGALIAGLLDELLPQRWLTAIIPRNPFLAVAIGGMLGLVFPICECGIVPIMRRLLRKGLPLSACVAYLLAGPIVNPVVIGSTFAAFNGMENTFIAGVPAYQMSDGWMVLFRTGMGYFVAVSTAMIVELFWRRYGVELLTPLTRPSASAETEVEVGPPRTLWQRTSHISATSLHDFVDITVFLILGALLAAGTRMFLTPEVIADLGTQHIMLTILLLMGLAIVLCLCSEADAFVAASFVTLPPAAKVSFLVLGPMVDIKLYALYLLIFRPRLIVVIYFSVVLQVFVLSVATHYFWETYKEQLVTPKMPEAEKLSETEAAEQAVRFSFAISSMGTALTPTTYATATAWLALDPEEKATEMRFLALESAAENAAMRTFYQGRLVWMSGRFSGSDRGFVLIRYKYNCCAADAVPLQAFLVPKDPLLTVPADDYQGRWVKVTGRIDFRPERGRYVPYIVLTPPDKRSWDKVIQVIEQPSNPFIY